MNLDLDRSGNPSKGSDVVYQPRGSDGDLIVVAVYVMAPDRSIAAPSSLHARSIIGPKDATGGFLLTINGQEFRSSRPGLVTTGDPRLHGKAEVTQYFELKGPLLDAIAAGGAGRLSYLDNKGSPLMEADLSFAPAMVIQGAVEKTYPTALALATNKSSC